MTLSTGGSASNFAVWLGSLEVETHLIARVGAGDKAKLSAEFLAKGVSAHLQEDSELPTGTIAVLVEGENRTFYTERGANKNLEVSMLPVDLFGDFLYISGYTVLSIGPDATQKLIAMAQQHGMLVVCDPGSSGFIRDYGAQEFLDAIAGTDVIFPNQEEAEVLTGESAPQLAADLLSRKFPLVVLTMGPAGAFVRNPTTAEQVPGFKTQSVDPTGAGDAFAAMFMRELLDGQGSLIEVTSRACEFAAQATKFIGGQPNIKSEN